MPVAVNLYRIREAEDEGGRLFRSVQRQKDQYQGLWVVSPDGTVLAGHDQSRDDARAWARDVLETLDTGLKSFGAVTPRSVPPADPLPFRGHRVRPDGGIRLAIDTRYMHDEKPDGPPVIDSLSLTKVEWDHFLPPSLAEGTTWTIPEATARKLVRVLSPSSDQVTMPRPEDATVAELRAVVEANDGTTARIRWTGTLAANHVFEGDANRVSISSATVDGVARAEVSTRSLESLLMVARGVYRAPPPYDEPRQTGGVVEWSRTRE